MKMQESAENYLETILMLKERYGQVRSIDIANEMGFTKPSVSIAMRRLRENGYIKVDENGYITLEETGFEVASTIYERHQILTEFLMSLGVSEETSQKDACKIEHAISNESYQRLKEYYKKIRGK